MHFASALTTTPGAEGLRELATRCLDELGDGRLDLGLVFFHPSYAPFIEDFAQLLDDRGLSTLVGTSGNGVLDAGQECDGEAAASLLLGRMPGCYVEAFAVAESDLEEAGDNLFGLPRDTARAAVLLVDGFTVDPDAVLARLEALQTGVTVVGGLSSGGQGRGEHFLLAKGRLGVEGAVGLAIAGAVELVTVVSQGCRPFGSRAAVTGVKDRYLIGLRGRPAVDVLAEEIETLDEPEREKIYKALHLGVVMDEHACDPGRGDFLIRNILGIDPRVRALFVGERLRMGQTVQFHLRDADTADEDFRALLSSHQGDLEGRAPGGGLLFSCCGRGRHFFGAKDHDVELVREVLGAVPLAGFFCNGELGPVAGRHYLHGYTSVLALFRPAAPSESA